MYSPLYVHIKQGSAFNPKVLIGEHAVRADYVRLENGDTVGKVVAKSAEARKQMEAAEGVTVLPPLHRPIKAHHAAAFAHVDAQEGEAGYDIAERLCEHHAMPWFHPEEWFL